MASITSLSNSYSSASSIYGNRNVLSGLASGMDTEAMIENAVSGIKTKISSLQQKRTKVEWQQEAYRSIIDKMVNFNDKYTSYSSSTNLLSSSFFNKAVLTTAKGEFKDSVSANGKTSSDIKLMGVKQLATAATYRKTGLGANAQDLQAVTSKEAVDLNAILPQSTISGSMTLNYGGNRTFDLKFDNLEIYEDADKLAEGIREKLSEISVTTNSGESKKASDMVKVSVENGNIVFSDGQNAGNQVYLSSASGKIKDTLGIDPSKKSSTLNVSRASLVDESKTAGEYVSGQEISVTLDGVTKKITLPEFEKDTTTDADFLKGIQESLDKAFGKNKITATNQGTDGKFGLSLQPQDGSTMYVSGNAAEALGLEKNGSANYIDTGKKLGDLMGDDYEWGSEPKDLTINGVKIGSYDKNTTLESIMTAINSNPDAGVKVSYSKLSNQFQFTATETGENGKIEFDGLGKDLFGDTSTDGEFAKGKDAIFTMKVNGKVYDGITRSSNTFDVDGLNITLKDTFGDYIEKPIYDGEDGETAYVIGEDNWDAAEKKAVTFETSTDVDKVVDAIKSMVNDYNEMVTEIKNAYSTLPAEKSDGSRYDPLTDDDKDGMSDSAIERYEELAKQGILFGDSDLSSLYNKLRDAITPGNTDGQTLREIGIQTSYSSGLTTISLDEEALRNALTSDPDKVKNAFTKSKESGASSNGLMQSLQNTLDAYAKRTGEPKGILITRAGSIKAPTSLNNNSLQTQLNSIDKQIERWQEKMSDQIDRYTTKFSRLEQLIAEMNSQAESLAGLMGGY